MSIQIILYDHNGDVIEDMLLPGALSTPYLQAAVEVAKSFRKLGIACEAVGVRQLPASDFYIGYATLDGTVSGIEEYDAYEHSSCLAIKNK